VLGLTLIIHIFIGLLAVGRLISGGLGGIQVTHASVLLFANALNNHRA
jgi:hypothetical protein